MSNWCLCAVWLTWSVRSPLDRGWAHRSHRQVWLRWPIIPGVVLQEGRLAAAVPASLRRLVGGTAQWHRWPGATPVHRGPRCVSFYFGLFWMWLSSTQFKSRINLHVTNEGYGLDMKLSGWLSWTGMTSWITLNCTWYFWCHFVN